MSGEQPIEFFHPGLGSIHCTLIAADGEAVRSTSLVGAKLDPGGAVMLEVGGGADQSHLVTLADVEEQRDGTMVLHLSDGQALSVPSIHAARARDVVLSLANRITPYF